MRRGFTLVELLVVLVVLAVLAGIAVQRYSRTKDRAYVAAMQSELRSLVSAQELFRSDSMRYAGDIAELPMVRQGGQVRLTIDAADATTWSATARHAATTRTCTLAGGVGAPGGSLGEAACP